MTGSLSLAATGLPAESRAVPAGTMNGPRGLPVTVSRLGVRMFLGVPTNIGLGSWIFRTSLPGSWAAAAGGQHGQAEDEQGERTGERFFIVIVSLRSAGPFPATAPALNILHFSGPVFTRAQTTGCRPQKPATSSVDMTMKAVERASEAAADGWEAQAAACPAAGRPVRGSTTCAPLTSVPEPLRARSEQEDAARPGRPVRARPGADGPAPALARSRRTRTRGQGRARPGVEEDVPDLPIPEHGQGGVEGVALADRPEIEVDERRGRPSLRPEAGHLEAAAVRVDPEELVSGAGKPGAGPAAGRPAGPEVIDVEGVRPSPTG